MHTPLILGQAVQSRQEWETHTHTERERERERERESSGDYMQDCTDMMPIIILTVSRKTQQREGRERGDRMLYMYMRIIII